MARRRRVVIQSHAGREGPVFTIALTPDAFTISAGFRPEDSLATSMPVGFSANHSQSSKYEGHALVCLVIGIFLDVGAWDLEFSCLLFAVTRPPPLSPLRSSSKAP